MKEAKGLFVSSQDPIESKGVGNVDLDYKSNLSSRQAVAAIRVLFATSLRDANKTGIIILLSRRNSRHSGKMWLNCF